MAVFFFFKKKSSFKICLADSKSMISGFVTEFQSHLETLLDKLAMST